MPGVPGDHVTESGRSAVRSRNRRDLEVGGPAISHLLNPSARAKAAALPLDRQTPAVSAMILAAMRGPQREQIRRPGRSVCRCASPGAGDVGRAMTVTGFDSYDLLALEIAGTGGAPCPLPVLEYFQGKGVPFQRQAFFSCTDARMRQALQHTRTSRCHWPKVPAPQRD